MYWPDVRIALGYESALKVSSLEQTNQRSGLKYSANVGLRVDRGQQFVRNLPKYWHGYWREKLPSEGYTLWGPNMCGL